VKHVAEFLLFARYLGIEKAESMRRGRRHPRLIGEFDGHKVVFAFPGTPGDHRSMLNARCALRRKLGLTHAGKSLRAVTKGDL
jgi:hypothetical protein